MVHKKLNVNFLMGRILGGGIETVLMTYLKNFDRNKYSVTLTICWAMHEFDSFTSRLPSDVKVNYLVDNNLLTYYKIKKIKAGKLNLLEKTIENLILLPIGNYVYKKNFLKSIHSYDCIIDFAMSLPLSLLGTNKKIISFLHFDLNSYLQGKPRKTYRFAQKINKYDVIVTLNNQMLKDCQSKFPDYKNKFYCIYNMFDLENIRKLSYLALPYEIILPDKFIVSVCRLEESQKDVTTLIRAFNKLVKNYSYHGKLLLVGDGKSRAILEEIVKQYNLENLVVFMGNQHNPYIFMRMAQVFVLSSKFEGLPSVLIEAMALDVPIVSTDCPVGPKEMLMDGSCGTLVEIGDADNMAKSIDTILQDSLIRNNLIYNANIRVNDFSLANLEQLYNLIEIVTR